MKTTMTLHKSFAAMAALTVALGANAQTTQCDFETEDYAGVSTYDSWVDSPMRDARFANHARVVDNPYKDDVNPTDKVVGFQRSRYGGMFYGARIDLNEPIVLSPTKQYVHAFIYSPKGGQVGLVALGKRATFADQEPDAEQLITLGTMEIPAGAWADAVFPIKGNENARIMSLVIAPDACTNPGDGDDFMAYIDNITVNNSAAPRVASGDYALNFSDDADMTRSDRHLDGISFNVNGVTSSTTTPTCSSKVYADLTQEFTVSVKPGDRVNITYDWTGRVREWDWNDWKYKYYYWMHNYTYVDWDNDGKFDVDYDTPTQSRDLMSFSYYNGRNSEGNSAAEAPSNFNAPSYTVPANQPYGFYRGRTKIDWDNIDPAGNTASNNYIIDTGGNIVDYIINVHGDEVSLSVDTRMCTVTQSDGNALPATIAFGRDFPLHVQMDEGFQLDGLSVKHGHNLNGAQYVHGNRQWRTDTLRFEGLSTLTLPAEWIDGDVSVSVLFSNFTPNFPYDVDKVYNVYSVRAKESLTSEQANTDGATMTGDVVTSENDDADDYAALWQFEPSGYGYKLKNLNAGAYYLAASDNATLTGADNASVLFIGEGNAADNWTLNVINGDEALGENTYLNARHLDSDSEGRENHGVGTWRDGAGDEGNLWMLREVNSVTVNVSDALWATLHLPFAVRIPEGVTAYTGGAQGDGVVKLHEVDGVIPAHTPVVLNADLAGAYAFPIAYEAANEPPVPDNTFLGTGLRLTGLVPQSFYALANPSIEDGFGIEGVGFYIGTANVTSLPANKTYMLRDMNHAAAGYRFTFGDAPTVGIDQTARPGDGATKVYYDLHGRRVLYPSHGVYVTQDGQKVFIK